MSWEAVEQAFLRHQSLPSLTWVLIATLPLACKKDSQQSPGRGSSSTPSLLCSASLSSIHPLAAPLPWRCYGPALASGGPPCRGLGEQQEGLEEEEGRNRHRALWALWMQKPDSLQRQLCCSWSLWGASISPGSEQAGSKFQGTQGGCLPSGR